MSFIAGAIIIGAGVGLASAAMASSSSRRASHEASQAQSDATAAGIESQERMFDIGREDLAPYRQAGYNALGVIQGTPSTSSTSFQDAQGNVYTPVEARTEYATYIGPYGEGYSVPQEIPAGFMDPNGNFITQLPEGVTEVTTTTPGTPGIDPTGGASRYQNALAQINPMDYMGEMPNLPTSFNPDEYNPINNMQEQYDLVNDYTSTLYGENALGLGLGERPTITDISEYIPSASAFGGGVSIPTGMNITPRTTVPMPNAPDPLSDNEMPQLNLPEFQVPEFEEDAYYLWQQEQGEKAINRAAAARGQYGSTSTVGVLSDFNTQLIAEETRRQYERAVDDYERRYGAEIDRYNLSFDRVMAQWNQGYQVYQTQADMATRLREADIASQTSLGVASIGAAASRANAITSAQASLAAAGLNAQTQLDVAGINALTNRMNSLDTARYNATLLGLDVNSEAYNRYVQDYQMNYQRDADIYNMDYGRGMDIYNLNYGRNSDLYDRTYGQGMDQYNMAMGIGGREYGQQIDIANLGAGAAATSAAGAINTGQGMAQSYNALGNAQAQGILGAGQAQGQFWSGIGNIVPQSIMAYNALSQPTQTYTPYVPPTGNVTQTTGGTAYMYT